MRTALVTLMMCVLALPVNAKYSGGTGEPNDPYQIATAADLIALGETPEDYDKHFILTGDIDLDPNLPGRKVFDKAVIAPDNTPGGWPLGGAWFTGVFDGKGHTVAHLTITGDSYLGLFGGLSSAFGGSVKNLGAVDVRITGSGASVGGLVGETSGGTVTQCYTTGTVSGGSYVGGLIGYHQDDVVTHCYSTVTVSGNSFVGGLIGYCLQGAAIRCYSAGAVSGIKSVGGLIGGKNNKVTVKGCFWDVQVSGQVTSTGGEGKTTLQMRDMRTYQEAGWDFLGREDGLHEVWEMPQGGYPVLAIFSGYTRPQLAGAGTAEDPYVIADSAELGAMIYYSPDGHYRVGASIDLAGIHWRVPVILTFAGKLDGNGHTISGLTITGEDYLGLFGTLEDGAEVRDLGLVDVNVAGSGDWVGGVAGWNDGDVIQCFSTGTVSGKDHVGGIAGWNYGGNIARSYSTAAATGDKYVGGLVGRNSMSCDIEVNCLGGNITQCYSTGTVKGNSLVGGLVGENYDVVDRSDAGRITSSFWDIETSGQATSAGGTGRTTAEMRDPDTFIAAGWDLAPHDIWFEPEGGGYPILWWQLSPWPSLPRFSGGTGEAHDPYLISTREELNSIGHNPRLMQRHFKLARDLDLAGIDSYPIGNLDYPYRGIFDGNRHALSNLRVRGESYLGFFGRLAGGSMVKDLGVVDVNIIGSDNAGSGDYVGGLAGSNSGNLIRCYSTGSIIGQGHVGGLVGMNSGEVTNCYSSSIVVGTGIDPRALGRSSGVGGLVGTNTSVVTGCHSDSAVTGRMCIGGLVGYNWPGTVTQCYSTGSVAGNRLIGGLVGWSGDAKKVTACFWDIQTSGQATSAGGTGLTTAEMQTAKTFLDAGWDFVGETANGTEDIWKIAEGLDYPRLWWEPYDGRFTVVLGQVFTVTLESNPSTGYRWEWVDHQDSIVEQMGEAQFKPRETGDPPLVGAGGWESFDFKAVHPGQMTLKLVYRRPWEEGVEPLKTFSLQVTVP